MPNKLTDKEIVKALKEILELMCCEGDLQRASTISNAIDLINRLQAENERLREDVCKEFICFVGDPHKVRQCPYLEEVPKAKAEARKEFAERLKAKAPIIRRSISGSEYYEFDSLIVDNLLKEMESANND